MQNVWLLQETLLNWIWNNRRTLLVIIGLSVVALAASSIPIAAVADERTYLSLASSMLEGSYERFGVPSTFPPPVPLLTASLQVLFGAEMAFYLGKVVVLACGLLGIRVAYLTLLHTQLDKRLVYLCCLLTLASSVVALILPRLYPDGLIMLAFWGFAYFYVKPPHTVKHWILWLLIALCLLFLRYSYGLLGAFIVLQFIHWIRSHATRKQVITVIAVAALLCVPLLLWVNYLTGIETTMDLDQSYFNRYKDDGIWGNIKFGLGLEQSPENVRTNGIPAFASTFVPVTGFRSLGLSLTLLAAIAIGGWSLTCGGNRSLAKLIGKVKNTADVSQQINTSLGSAARKKLLAMMVLSLLGLVLAGTGFSRYWISLLPLFWVCLFATATRLRILPWAILASGLLIMGYVANNLRLIALVLDKWL